MCIKCAQNVIEVLSKCADMCIIYVMLGISKVITDLEDVRRRVVRLRQHGRIDEDYADVAVDKLVDLIAISEEENSRQDASTEEILDKYSG